MERITHREYKVRLAWLEMQWDKPSRSDWYLMRIIQLLDAIWHRRTRLKELENFRVPFEKPKKTIQSGQDRQRSERSHSVWGAAMKAAAKRMTRGK